MYEAFFRLKARPFAAAPVVHHYYPGESIEQARQTCIRAIERAEGPVLAIGPAGVGKTLLCRLLTAYFESTFHVALLSNTRIGTHKSLLQNILFELRLPYRELDEGELRLRLIDYLQPSEDCPNGVLLIIDEAHTLSIRLLEELRMLTNVVRDGQPRVRLVLAGGSRLDERFAHPKLESFNQRVAARCYLPPMHRMETDDYVRSQLALAGGSADAIFSEDAFRAIFQATDGIPRLINQVCNHALTLACQAGCRRLEAATIEEAWADLQQLPAPWHEKSVEADSPSAFIEFGQLDAGFPDPGDTALDMRSSPVARCDEMLELLSTGQAEVSPAIVFGSMASAIHDAQGLEPPSLEDCAEFPLAEPTSDVPATPAIQPATNPFDATFAEEEFIQDPIACGVLPANRAPATSGEPSCPPPLPHDELDSTTDQSAYPLPPPVDACDASDSSGQDPSECLSPSANDPPLDEPPQPVATSGVAVVAGEDGADKEVDDAGQTNEGLLTDSPQEQEASAVPPSEPSLEMFEYTILQELDAGGVILDTAALFAEPETNERELEEDDVDECVSFASDADSPEDDRDLIQVADEEDIRAVAPGSPAENGNVRRVEYRTLFAQLRRNA